MAIYRSPDSVNLTNGAWLDALAGWESAASKKARPMMLARAMSTISPRVKLAPTGGTWSEDDLVYELPTFPAAWIRDLEAEKANDPAVLQILALATYANLLTHRPIIDEGARGSGDGESLLIVVAAIAALRAGITAATGVLPNRVSEPCQRLIKRFKDVVYLAGTHKQMVEHTWIRTFVELNNKYQKTLDAGLLRKVADLGPVAMSAGSALRSDNALAMIGRAHAMRLIERITAIFGNAKLADLTWAVEVIPLEATACFPASICLETIADPALAEAVSRCFPCSEDSFARSIRRESELRVQAKRIKMAPLELLRLDTGSRSSPEGLITAPEEEVSFDSDPEEETKSAASSPPATPRAAAKSPPTTRAPSPILRPIAIGAVAAKGVQNWT